MATATTREKRGWSGEVVGREGGLKSRSKVSMVGCEDCELGLERVAIKGWFFRDRSGQG